MVIAGRVGHGDDAESPSCSSSAPCRWPAVAWWSVVAPLLGLLTPALGGWAIHAQATTALNPAAHADPQ